VVVLSFVSAFGVASVLGGEGSQGDLGEVVPDQDVDWVTGHHLGQP
jgi:hypothetical protein